MRPAARGAGFPKDVAAASRPRSRRRGGRSGPIPSIQPEGAHPEPQRGGPVSGRRRRSVFPSALGWACAGSRVGHSSQGGIIYLKPQTPTDRFDAVSGDLPDAGAPEITPQMVRAGEEVLLELLEVREPAYVVRRVYQAMMASRQCRRSN
jgi:hypothetical protein